MDGSPYRAQALAPRACSAAVQRIVGVGADHGGKSDHKHASAYRRIVPAAPAC